MRVKINKVIPFRENLPKVKGQAFIIGKNQYFLSPYKLQQKNFTGFPVHLQLICTLPDPTVDYEYVKFQVTAQTTDYKQLISKRSQRFEDIKRGQHKRDFVFSFTPIKRGVYTIKVEAIYRPRYFINTNQQPDERKQGVQQLIRYEEPFEISQLFVTNDKNNSIVHSLFKFQDLSIVYTTYCSKQNPGLITLIQCVIHQLKFLIKVRECIQLVKSQDKNQFKLKNNQIYYTVLSVKPKQIKKFLSQKIQAIGQLNIKYGQKGQSRKKVNFRTNDRYIFFKASTLSKNIPKKDIVQVTIRFQKIYNANFGLGDLSIIINESLMEGIKIVKTSKGRVNLQKKNYQDVVFSIICLKSGFFHIKGLTLNTSDNRIVNYVNDITLFVQNEQEHKAPVFQNTTVIQIPEEDSLI